MKITDIESIKKFTQNENAWYHIIVPAYMTCDDMVELKRILDDSEIKGTFLLTTSDYTIRDITEYMQKHRLKDIE